MPHLPAGRRWAYCAAAAQKMLLLIAPLQGHARARSLKRVWSLSQSASVSSPDASLSAWVSKSLGGSKNRPRADDEHHGAGARRCQASLNTRPYAAVCPSAGRLDRQLAAKCAGLRPRQRAKPRSQRRQVFGAAEDLAGGCVHAHAAKPRRPVQNVESDGTHRWTRKESANCASANT